MAPAPVKLPRAAAVALGLGLGLACSHTDPFSTPPYGTDTPFDPTPPIRLTWNPGSDRDPAWSADAVALLYAAEVIGRSDADVCLAELPPTGGSQRRLDCDVAPGDERVTNAIGSPAAGADGRLASVRSRGKIGAFSPDSSAVVVGPSLDPAAASVVQRLPYFVSGQPPTSWVSQVRWLGQDKLLWLGGQVAYRPPCKGFPLDTITTGLQAAILDLASPGGGPLTIPETELVSGVAPGTPDQVYYTLGGDSRVYRRTLSGGVVDVVHDFGIAGIARDVDVVGSRLVAVVGGRVAFSTDAQLGPVQWDSGGVLHVVDLFSGSDIALDGPGLFRRPALAPTGDRFVAESYPLGIGLRCDGTVDTVVSHAPDLYLFELP